MARSTGSPSFSTCAPRASRSADPTPWRRFAYNVSTAIFGGTAPYANEKLIAVTGSNLVPAFYMMAACLIGAVGLAFVPETARASIRGKGVPGIDTQPKPLERAAATAG
jgi:MHS family proline/betaine transporter-like MFS transporter